MDSNPLERERGITILAKNTSVRWTDTKINIVDTPGHADFGGEVERILRMVDGVLLVVDAFDGPMPQTRFVLRKALELGRTPIVVINKIDRPGADPMRVHDEVLSLFIELEATEAQLDAPVVYASAKEGIATMDMDVTPVDLSPLFDTIVDAVPPPPSDGDRPVPDARSPRSTTRRTSAAWRSAASSAARCTWATRSRCCRSSRRGRMERRASRSCTSTRGSSASRSRERRRARSCRWRGSRTSRSALTRHRPRAPERLEGISVEEPTISVDFLVNNSPFAGKEGKFVTSRQLRERLYKELERNVALRVEDTESTDAWTVSGRGELHLSILMETMRREGYEFQVSRPRVILKTGVNGERLEPYEELAIDVPEDYLGAVIEKLGQRRAEMIEMKNPGQGLVRLLYRIPARGLFGYRSEFLTDTRGTGIMHHRFLEYGPWAGPLSGRSRGVLVSMENGTIVAFALVQPAGALDAVRVAGRRGVRGDDRRRELAAGRHGRESDEGEEAHEHPHEVDGREHHARAAAGAHAGERARVHRGRRADRDHAASIRLRKRLLARATARRCRARRSGSASAPRCSTAWHAGALGGVPWRRSDGLGASPSRSVRRTPVCRTCSSRRGRAPSEVRRSCCWPRAGHARMTISTRRVRGDDDRRGSTTSRRHRRPR